MLKFDVDNVIIRVKDFAGCSDVSVNDLPKPTPVENIHGVCPKALWNKIVSRGLGGVYNDVFSALADNDMWYSANRGLSIDSKFKKELLETMAHNGAVTYVSTKMIEYAKAGKK